MSESSLRSSKPTPKTLMKNVLNWKTPMKTPSYSLRSSSSTQSSFTVHKRSSRHRLAHRSLPVKSTSATPRQMLAAVIDVHDTAHSMAEFGATSTSHSNQSSSLGNIDQHNVTNKSTPLVRSPLRPSPEIGSVESHKASAFKKQRIAKGVNVQDLKNTVRPTFQKGGEKSGVLNENFPDDITFSPVSAAGKESVQQMVQSNSTHGKSISFASPKQMPAQEDIDFDGNAVDAVPVQPEPIQSQVQEQSVEDTVRKYSKKPKSRSKITFKLLKNTAFVYAGNHRIAGDALQTLYERLDEMLEILSGTLNAYAPHRGTRAVSVQDFVLLFTRAGWINEKDSLSAFLSQYLELDERCKFIECATSGNRIL